MGFGKLQIDVEWATRRCKVGDQIGYFHCWEYFSQPLGASPFIGDAPAGVFSRIFGIVEFHDGVRRVEVPDIHFCDDENEVLKELYEKL